MPLPPELHDAATRDGFVLYEPQPMASAVRWKAFRPSPQEPPRRCVAFTCTGGRPLSPGGLQAQHTAMPSVVHATPEMVVFEHRDGLTLHQLAAGQADGMLRREAALAVFAALVDLAGTISPNQMPPLHPATVRMGWEGALSLEGWLELVDPAAAYGYLSPEQVVGHPRHEPATVFMLGALFYWLVTGAHPFASTTAFGALERVRGGNIERAPLERLSDALLSFVVEQCLQKEPAARVSLPGLRAGIAHLAQSYGSPWGPTDLAALLEPHAPCRAQERAQLQALGQLDPAELEALPPLLVAAGPRIDERARWAQAIEEVQQTMVQLERSSTALDRIASRLEATHRGWEVVPGGERAD